MDTRVERRRPDRHLVALRLMRRIAILALVLSAGLWIVPARADRAGPDRPRGPRSAWPTPTAPSPSRAPTEAASLPVYQQAEHERDRARELVAQRAGARGASRRGAGRRRWPSRRRSRPSCAARTSQQRAQVVYTDLDKQINDLEKLYSATAPGLEKAAGRRAAQPHEDHAAVRGRGLPGLRAEGLERRARRRGPRPRGHRRHAPRPASPRSARRPFAPGRSPWA